MEETPDELYVYDKVQFRHLLRSGEGIFSVDQNTVELCLMDGGLEIRLPEQLLARVAACIHEEHTHVLPKVSSSEEEDDDEERDRGRERARLAEIGQLPRSLRTRQPSARA